MKIRIEVYTKGNGDGAVFRVETAGHALKLVEVLLSAMRAEEYVQVVVEDSQT